MPTGDDIYTETHSVETNHNGFDALEKALLRQERNSLDTAVRRKLGLTPNHIDDRNDPPTLDDTAKIRPLDAYTAFPSGRDYMIPRVRIVPNTHPKASDDECAVHISQGSQGVSLTIETLRAILSWAEGK